MKEKTKIKPAFYYPTEDEKAEITKLAKKFGVTASRFVILKALGRI